MTEVEEMEYWTVAEVEKINLMMKGVRIDKGVRFQLLRFSFLSAEH